jgi:putative ATPase
VLDLRGDSGLLTWEAVRHAPEGGVWTIAHNSEAGEVFRQQAQRLPELERPVVLIGSIEELDYLMEMRGESDVRFDCILGRNAFTNNQSRLTVLSVVAVKLRPGGRLCLAQIVPQESQRLYEMVDWSKLPAGLANKVREAEEAIYHDPSDGMVNWNLDDLVSDLRASTIVDLQMNVVRQLDQRKISVEYLQRWFGDGLSQESTQEERRLSYGERLAEAGLDNAEIGQVAALYRRQLVDQVVAWKTTLAFIWGRS